MRRLTCVLSVDTSRWVSLRAETLSHEKCKCNRKVIFSSLMSRRGDGNAVAPRHVSGRQYLNERRSAHSSSERQA